MSGRDWGRGREGGCRPAPGGPGRKPRLGARGHEVRLRGLGRRLAANPVRRAPSGHGLRGAAAPLAGASVPGPRRAPAGLLHPPPRRVAVFRALFLGDLLCATPAFRALRQRFPAAEITLIGLPWARDLAERLPYLDHFTPFPGYTGIIEVPYEAARTERFLAEARETGYDLAIQMHGSGAVSNGFVAVLGARMSLGYGHADDDRLTLCLAHDPHEHETVRWLRLVGALGENAERGTLPGQARNAEQDEGLDVRLDFPITSDDEERAANLLAAAPEANPFRNRHPEGTRSAIRNPLVGLHAGAKDAGRRWPPERFAALADALIARRGARIVLTGSAGERELTAAVRGAMRGAALDLAGATDLGAFAALIGRLDLLVTNDTGASHLAAAAGTPSVVLFGPTRPAQWAPLDRARHRVIDALALAGPGSDPAAALRSLPVEPVLAACAAALDQPHPDLRPSDPSPRSGQALRPSTPSRPSTPGASCGG